jgi:5'-3' exonuclease
MKHNLWNYLESLKSQLSVKHEDVVLCFDPTHDGEPATNEKSSWRYKVAKEYGFEYKKNRKINPEVDKWINYMEEKAKRSGYVCLKFDKLEGDDLIALYIRNHKNSDCNKEVVIVSSDKDFLQLLDSNTKLYDVKEKKIMEISQKDAKSEAYIKVCIGDSSDTIPNVTKGLEPSIRFGEKTVKEIIKSAISWNLIFKTEKEHFREKIFEYVLNEAMISFENRLKGSLKEKEEILSILSKKMEDNIERNYNLISFSRIPVQLTIPGRTYISNVLKDHKRISYGQLGKFYDAEKCSVLSEKYKKLSETYKSNDIKAKEKKKSDIDR